MKPELERLAPAWKKEPLLSRLQSCRIQLACYGLLTDSENEMVKRQIAQLANEEKEAKS